MTDRRLSEAIAKLITLATESFEGTPCWRWLGTHRKSDGRPIHGKEYAYRKIYELLIGPLPRGKGHASHHRCERKWCINPWHVGVMSQGDHMRTHGFGGDWGEADKTHCPAGHPYDEANTYRYKGERQCRACMKENSRRSYYANLEKNRAKAREYQRLKRIARAAK